MNDLLQQLIDNDHKLKEFCGDQEIIDHGLGPIKAEKQAAIAIHKNNLLEQAKRDNWQKKALEVFQCFNQHNIPFLVFKGFAYTHLLYKGSHVRPYTDIDIFIDQSDYSRVIDLLTSLGYQCYPSRQGRFVSFQNSFYDQNSPQCVLDVHWQINNRIELHQYFPFSEVYAKTITLGQGEHCFHTLSLTDAFIVACFHYQGHRPEDRKHIWLYDLALLWLSMSADQQQVSIKKAKFIQQVAIVQAVYALLVDTFGSLMAEKLCVIDDLHNNQNIELSPYTTVKRSKIKDISYRLSTIKGIKNKLIFISEYVFQSPEYMKHRFGLQNKRWFFMYYPKMWLQDLIKLFKRPQ